MAKQISGMLRIVRMSLLRLLANPKLYVGIILLVIGLITCYGGVRDSLIMRQTDLQFTELFILTLNARIPRYILTFILLLLVSGTPFPHSGFDISLIRAGRSTWLAGQMLYLAVVAFLILAATELILCGILAGQLTFQNEWSQLIEYAARLGSGAGLSLLGIDMQIPIPTEAILTESPMTLFLLSLLNGFCFSYLMAMICMCGNLYKKGLCSMIVVILLLILGLAVESGIIPEIGSMILPFSVASISLRPVNSIQILYTVLYFAFLIFCLVYASWRQMKRCDITALSR